MTLPPRTTTKFLVRRAANTSRAASSGAEPVCAGNGAILPAARAAASPKTTRAARISQTLSLLRSRTVVPSDCAIRPARPGDESGAYYVCLKTGDHGADAEHLYADDPDALGRIFVGPYLAFERELSLILEDDEGICGYALGALDSRSFFERYEREWRPDLCRRFAEPSGDSRLWTPAQHVHHSYHHPDYFCPEPYAQFPSHLHIDLLPRAQGRGYGRQLIDRLEATLRDRGSPGVHLGLSARNMRAFGFYRRLGFQELTRTGSAGEVCVYMGKRL